MPRIDVGIAFVAYDVDLTGRGAAARHEIHFAAVRGIDRQINDDRGRLLRIRVDDHIADRGILDRRDFTHVGDEGTRIRIHHDILQIIAERSRRSPQFHILVPAVSAVVEAPGNLIALIDFGQVEPAAFRPRIEIAFESRRRQQIEGDIRIASFAVKVFRVKADHRIRGLLQISLVNQILGKDADRRRILVVDERFCLAVVDERFRAVIAERKVSQIIRKASAFRLYALISGRRIEALCDRRPGWDDRISRGRRRSLRRRRCGRRRRIQDGVVVFLFLMTIKENKNDDRGGCAHQACDHQYFIAQRDPAFLSVNISAHISSSCCSGSVWDLSAL